MYATMIDFTGFYMRWAFNLTLTRKNLNTQISLSKTCTRNQANDGLYEYLKAHSI